MKKMKMGKNFNNSRKCIATNKIKSKEELIRIVKTKDGNYFVDSDKKGRGAYISKDETLVPILKKKRLLNRTFKTNVPEKVYEELINVMEGNNER